MQSCNLLLCKGNGFLSKRIIRYNHLILGMTGPAAEISHVAMTGPEPDQVFEATTLNKWCGKRGVQINLFNDWYRNYDGQIWIRRHNHGFTHLMIAKAKEAMKKLEGTPYENGIPGAIELLLAGISFPWLSENIKQALRTKDGVHCSEVDALVLKKAGVLHETVRPNKLPPCKWWEEMTQLNWCYGTPERIK